MPSSACKKKTIIARVRAITRGEVAVGAGPDAVDRGLVVATVVSQACAAVAFFFFFNATATTEIYTLSLHDALPISFDADPKFFACLVRFESSSVPTKTQSE